MLPNSLGSHSMEPGSTDNRRFSGSTILQTFHERTQGISLPAQTSNSVADYFSSFHDPFAPPQVPQAEPSSDRPVVKARRRSQRLSQQVRGPPAKLQGTEGDYFSISHRESFALPEVPKDIQRFEGPTAKSRKRSRRESEMSSGFAATHVGVVNPIEQEEDSEPDKKRNKLGYQRSNIACVHCRRRKIRCVVSINHPSGSCAHCVRLKKDCVFVPVDDADPCKKKRPGVLKKAKTEPAPVPQVKASGSKSSSAVLVDITHPSLQQQPLLPSSNLAQSVEQSRGSYSDQALADMGLDMAAHAHMPPILSYGDYPIPHADVFSDRNIQQDALYDPLTHTTSSAMLWDPISILSSMPTMSPPTDSAFPDIHEPLHAIDMSALPQPRASVTAFPTLPSGAMSTAAIEQPSTDSYFAPAVMATESRSRSTTFPLPSIPFEGTHEGPRTGPYEATSSTSSMQMPFPPSLHSLPSIFLDNPRHQTSSTAYLSPITLSSGPRSAFPSLSPMPPSDASISPLSSVLLKDPRHQATAYLSPITSSSGTRSALPSVSPMPPRDALLSPPTSEVAIDNSMYVTSNAPTSQPVEDPHKAYHSDFSSHDHFSGPFGHTLDFEALAEPQEILQPIGSDMTENERRHSNQCIAPQNLEMPPTQHEFEDLGIYLPLQ